MDSAFNQPTSTTPMMNWQLDQCYREGCKLERELAAVTEQRDRLLAEREQWRMSSVCSELSEQLDRLAEQKESNYKVSIAIGRMFIEVKEQRDRLTEELKEAQNAIEMMLRDSSCRRIPAYTEEQLAAVKGGSDE